MASSEKLSAVETPPDVIPSLRPVSSVVQNLPFGELTWENFERLCHRLASLDDVEHCARYGRHGQAQGGIDIFQRKANGRYDVWQAKRYKAYSVTDLKSAVTTFLKGDWLKKSDTLVIAVQATLADTKIQLEIEAQVKRLKRHKVLLRVLGGDELSLSLRTHPQLILEFFGRDWTKAFLGPTFNEGLLEMLDGAEISTVRDQLRRVYENQFHLLDHAALDTADMANYAQSETKGLLARFTRLDVLLREFRDISARPKSADSAKDSFALPRIEETSKVERDRRVPLLHLLSQSNHVALLGDAGTGKSTVLRCIALDLIGKQTEFPELSPRWGGLIPIYLSFAKWARATAEAGGPVSLKDVVKASLQPLMTANLLGLIDRAVDERRILLLVDGLDEWANEQAARVTLQTLQTYIGVHAIPTVVTARPRGMSKIGAIPQNWMSGTLAPLSAAQQRQLVMRYLGIVDETSEASRDGQYASIYQLADRFFRELKREASLGALAETPLLLISLLVLAVKKISLPKNRAKALEQLIDILIDVHPQSRATAAGDVRARFNFVNEFEVRKGAVAALAFASRSEGRDAGYPRVEARSRIKVYLSNPQTHGFSDEKALQAASEILAVNAETVGLLVEKGHEEIGFVHASLEEFLSAIHIQSWPLDELKAFVGENATDVRWRNVIANLVAVTRRPAEIDQIVTAIEEAESDSLGGVAKAQLLADIAFLSSMMPQSTARRLGARSIERVERPGALKERREIFSSVLNGIGHPILGDELLTRIKNWAPKTYNSIDPIARVLGTWPPSPDLLRALKRGLLETQKWGQQSAVEAIAGVFSGNEDVQQWLLGLLCGMTDIKATSAAIRALVIGWPSTPGLEKIIDEAAQSCSSTLRLVAIWASVKLHRHTESHLFELLDLLVEPSVIDYADTPLGTETLILGWVDHPIAIQRCLEGIHKYGFQRRGQLDREVGRNFLLACSPDNQSVCEWLADELQQDHPFVWLRTGWDDLIRFARQSDIIKERLITVSMHDRYADMGYQVADLIVATKDERLKAFAIAKVRGEEASWAHSWYLRSLLDGWPGDEDVLILLSEVRLWPSERLKQIVGLLPRVFPDQKKCRELLLSLLALKGTHANLFPRAFREAGCDASDVEVIKALLEAARNNRYWGCGEGLISNYSESPLVQEYAISLLRDREPPLATIAHAYAHVESIRSEVLAQVGSLHASLRYLLAEVASIDAEEHAELAALLDCYDWETDCDLKVVLSIRKHELLSAQRMDQEAEIERLLDDAQAVGPDLDQRRAAAVAGLITLGGMDRFWPLIEGKEPLKISQGDYFEESGALLELISKNWTVLKSSQSGRLIERIGRFSSSESSNWDSFAPYLIWDTELRQDFLEYCEGSGVLMVPSLRALAKERPNSELLERHCWLAIDSEHPSGSHSSWDSTGVALEAAYILRAQLPGRQDIEDRLFKLYSKQNEVWRLVMLGIYSPEHQLLKTFNPLELGEKYGNWVAACTISAAVQGSVEFVGILRAMVNRRRHNIWDFQEFANVAVIERLTKDGEAVAQIKHILKTGDLSPNEWASLPRFLNAVSAVDEISLAVFRERFGFFSEKKGGVTVGYDALLGEIRPVAHSLLDVLR